MISAIYGLRAVACIFFGEAKEEIEGGDIKLSEKLPALLLLISLFIIGLWPKLVSDPVNESVNQTFADKVPTLSVPAGEPSSSE